MRRRPFKTRNADEFELSEILRLFVDPVKGTRSPFDYENTIIKGRKGSGKTMYLRANHAYHLYTITERLLNEESPVLPVFIKLNDFQALRDPDEIYKRIILAICTGIQRISEKLSDAEYMARIHFGMQRVPRAILTFGESEAAAQAIINLSSEEYCQRTTSIVRGRLGFKPSFIELFGETQKVLEKEILTKPNPSISDVERIYDILLSGTEGKLLLLLDEAGALSRDFFSDSSGEPLFEILMNQFRTASYIRTKVAVYPNSYSDILSGVRYGDIIELQERVRHESSYPVFRQKLVSLIENYLNVENVNVQGERFTESKDLFDYSTELGDSLEQVINGSSGNYRRLIQILDLSTDLCYQRAQGEEKVRHDDVLKALEKQGRDAYDRYTTTQQQFLDALSKTCKARGTYKFKFPNKALSLYKYQNGEHSAIRVEEPGMGRRSTVYSFDYAHCVLKEIPTHHLKGTEKLDRKRSLTSGHWVEKTATISQELMSLIGVEGKVEGHIDFIHGESGFILGDDEKRYYFDFVHIIKADITQKVYINRRVRFRPMDGADTPHAEEIELP